MGELPFFKGIRLRIVAYTSVCVGVVAITGNLFIYQYLSDIISYKTQTIQQTNMDFIAAQLNEELDKAWNLINLCSSHNTVVTAAESTSASTQSSSRFSLNAQQLLNNAIAGSGMSEYLNKMVVFRQQDDFMIQATTQTVYGTDFDSQSIQESALFQELKEQGFPQKIVVSSTSLSTNSAVPSLVSIQPITSGLRQEATAWFYCEFSMLMLHDIVSSFYPTGTYFICTNDGSSIYSESLPEMGLETQQQKPPFQNTPTTNGNWLLNSTPLQFDLWLCSATDSFVLQSDQSEIVHTVLLGLATTLAAGLGISIILSNLLTKPIRRLTKRIRKISENDLSYDPTIEQGQDEISQIGKVVNEMTLSVSHLLEETQHQAEQKRKIEIAMLQSQVNPHFLYNTLDSIHWMAVIQKNPGIQQMTRSLSNLLKNMAKGYDQKVPLEEEIKLLEDYVNIQSIRYMDTFELKNEIPPHLYPYSIIKLTLQPLVENAIFHGIEPTGRFGTIRLWAKEEENDLILCVEDDGVGMDAATIQKALAGKCGSSHGSMNGIGVGNVHQRLQLVYGSGYGLTIQSVVGEYTKMFVKIPKEEACSNGIPDFAGR